MRYYLVVTILMDSRKGTIIASLVSVVRNTKWIVTNELRIKNSQTYLIMQLEKCEILVLLRI